MTVSMKQFTTEIAVRSYELDSFGHVNHAIYLNYFEQARFEALESGGFPLREIYARGWGVHVVGVEVRYLKEVHLGDTLVIETMVDRMKLSSMIMAQRIYRKGAPDVTVTEAKVIVVWVGESGRPIRIPPAVREALEGS